MRIEQAIFTSARGARLEGYQLAAASAGIGGDLAQELTAWGPAHDSLWNGAVGATSVNFHPLAGNLFCVSRTTLAGAEYSGRGGGRVYTQMLVVPRETLARFASDPFLVLRVVEASGRLIVHNDLPSALPSIPLLGRGEYSTALESSLNEQVGSERLAELAEAVRRESPVAAVTDLPIERLFQAILHRLSPDERLATSFTTGLRPSSLRPFKLSIVPNDPQLLRQSQRASGGRVMEVFARSLSLAGG